MTKELPPKVQGTDWVLHEWGLKRWPSFEIDITKVYRLTPEMVRFPPPKPAKTKR